MRRTAYSILLIALFFQAMSAKAICQAPEPPQMPQPVKEHRWLQHLVGEWEFESEMPAQQGGAAMKAKGTETVRPLGGFWIVAESRAKLKDTPMSSVQILGYDPDKEKYIGTWVDSITGYLWKYEGKLDPTGKVLTLETEGPCPLTPGKMSKFKDAIELEGKNRKVLTSSMQSEDGKWTVIATTTYTRKKIAAEKTNQSAD